MRTKGKYMVYWLSLIHISSVYNKFPKELSGGMKQRCAIAQALSVDPPILLMDEPFGALDAVTRARLQDMLFDLWSGQASQKTVFFVTHDVDEALLLANRIVVLGQSPSNIIYECKMCIRDSIHSGLKVPGVCPVCRHERGFFIPVSLAPYLMECE